MDQKKVVRLLDILTSCMERIWIMDGLKNEMPVEEQKRMNQSIAARFTAARRLIRDLRKDHP